MKTAGIREFKARMSLFLREVQAGETLLITDRGRVVAEVRPPGAAAPSLSPAQVRYRQAMEDGLVEPASVEPVAFEERWAGFRGLGLVPGTAQELLDAGRSEDEA